VVAEAGKDAPEGGKGRTVIRAVDEDVVEVRDTIGEITHGQIHKAGEGARASGEAHGADTPLELAAALDREGRKGAGGLGQGHVVETGR
jgi:hypothetical protein